MGGVKDKERIVRMAMEVYVDIDPVAPFVQEATYHCLRDLFPDITEKQWEWFFRKYGDEIAPRERVSTEVLKLNIAVRRDVGAHYRNVHRKPQIVPIRKMAKFLSASPHFDKVGLCKVRTTHHSLWALNGYKHGRRPVFWIRE